MNTFLRNYFFPVDKKIGLITAIIILFIIPSINIEGIMNGTQTSKSITFCILLLFIGIAKIISLFSRNQHEKAQITLLDLLLFTWFIYIIINALIHKVNLSLQLLEFLGLSIFYYSIRQFNSKEKIILLLAALIGCFVQAIIGNLQLFGIIKSNHTLFKVTGSFFNPGPFGGYLAAIIPIALGFYLFGKRIQSYLSFDYLSKIGCLIALLIMTQMLLVSSSRAAIIASFIACGYILFIRYKHFFLNLYTYKIRQLKIVFLLLGGLIIIAACYSMIFLRLGSATGRVFVWSNSINIIKDNPLFGLGIGGFKSEYMNYQADYFKSNPNSKYLTVADDTTYAFNEFIQQGVENGILGIFLMLLITTVLFYPIQRRKVSDSFSVDSNIKNSLKDKKILLIMAKASLISIVIFSLFSYTSQVLPIKLILILALAILSSFHPILKFNFSLPKNFINRITSIFMICIILFIGCFVFQFTNGYVLWGKATKKYYLGYYKEALNEFKLAYPILRHDGDFLLNYGKASSLAENHGLAIKILNEASLQYPNTVLHNTLGDSYLALGQYKAAESNYLHAWYMNPSRFYPKYLLVKLYIKSGEKNKAISTAYEIINMKVKVNSTAIEEIKQEMQKVLNDLEKKPQLDRAF